MSKLVRTLEYVRTYIDCLGSVQISNIIWASTRDAHKQSKDIKPINRGHAHQRTYAKLATLASE